MGGAFQNPKSKSKVKFILEFPKGGREKSNQNTFCGMGWNIFRNDRFKNNKFKCYLSITDFPDNVFDLSNV